MVIKGRRGWKYSVSDLKSDHVGSPVREGRKWVRGECPVFETGSESSDSNGPWDSGSKDEWVSYLQGVTFFDRFFWLSINNDDLVLIMRFSSLSVTGVVEETSSSSLYKGFLSPSGILVSCGLERGFLDWNIFCLIPLQVWIPVKVFVPSETNISKLKNSRCVIWYSVYLIVSVDPFVGSSGDDTSLVWSFWPNIGLGRFSKFKLTYSDT